jgi:hypothetical protein
MNQYLRLPILPTVKFRIGLGSIFNANLMTDNERRFRATGYDHVAEVAVIGLNIALTGSDCQALF